MRPIQTPSRPVLEATGRGIPHPGFGIQRTCGLPTGFVKGWHVAWIAGGLNEVGACTYGVGRAVRLHSRSVLLW